MKIDLHSHSIHSDGTDSVKEILLAAEKLEIKGLCISDHDNFGGSIEANQIREGLYSGILVPGIEISTKVRGKTVHLLAYLPSFNLDTNHPLFINLEKIRTDRMRRMKKMIELANLQGFNITMEEVLEEVSGGGKQPVDVVSRPHFAKVFIKKGYARDLDDAFDNYIGEGKPIHATRFSLEYDEWISLVHDLGGLISWAHPLHGHKSEFDSMKKTAEILGNKVDAIELYYNYDGKYIVSKELQQKGREYLKSVIEENKLLITAGGDYHGNVGVLGVVDLPEKDWLRFQKRLFK